MPYKEGSQWRAKVTTQGQRHTSLHKTKKAALKWESDKRKELKKEERHLQKGLDLLTFCSKYQIYAERFTTKTHQEKKALCESIVKSWGKDFIVENITPEMIQTYLDDQAASRSNNASNRDRKNLMALWTYGRKFLGLGSDPLVDIEKRSHDRQPQYVPPLDDILKVFSVTAPTERLFLDCYIQTGARRSEIFRWTWTDDVSFQHRKVRLGSRKTKDGSMKYRLVDMSEALYNSLQWLWNNRKFKQSPFVWVNDHPGPHYGKPYKYRQRFLAGLCKRAGVRPFTFHSLRRFVASVLMDSGKVSLKQIQMLLGHSNLTTTERYIYSLQNDLKSTVEVLSEIKRHEGQARKEKEVNHVNG